MPHKQGKRKQLGDDGGCFAAALSSVRRCGGVLEHPHYSRAWKYFGIQKPPNEGGWIRADESGWTCCVYQGHYGHKALKPTWLYYVGEQKPPELKWGKPDGDFRPVSGRNFKSTFERQAAIAAGWKHTKRLSGKEHTHTHTHTHTPEPFRELLITLAKSSGAPANKEAGI